jgi:hypothetical protein
MGFDEGMKGRLDKQNAFRLAPGAGLVFQPHFIVSKNP